MLGSLCAGLGVGAHIQRREGLGLKYLSWGRDLRWNVDNRGFHTEMLLSLQGASSGECAAGEEGWMDAEPGSDARTGLLLHREEMLSGVLYSGPLRRAVLPGSCPWAGICDGFTSTGAQRKSPCC